MDGAKSQGTASDRELALRVATGSADAGAAETELYGRLAPRVRLYGLRHLRDPASADDLVQDVLMLTLERLRAGRVREPDRLAFCEGILYAYTSRGDSNWLGITPRGLMEFDAATGKWMRNGADNEIEEGHKALGAAP